MRKWVYLVPLESALGRSILHYSWGKTSTTGHEPSILMSSGLDSRIYSHPTKFKRRPWIFVKLSFRELSKSYLIYVLLIWPFHRIKEVKIWKVGCEFIKQQSSVYFLWPPVRTHLSIYLSIYLYVYITSPH